MNTPHQSYILECLLFFWIFVFSTRKRYLCAPLTFNVPIQKLSQIKFDQPSQRSQPSRAQLDVAGFQTSSVIGYRLSLIFLLVCLSLCVCELCVTVPLSPFSLSLGWLLNSSSTAAAWAICDLRYTIYDIHPTIDPIKQQLSP